MKSVPQLTIGSRKKSVTLAKSRACIERHIVGKMALIAPSSPKLPDLMGRLNHPVYRNRMLQLAADAVLVALAYFLAFQLRFLDEPHGWPERYQTLFLQSVGFVVVGKLAVFYVCGLYQKWWRYVSGRDFLLIFRAVAIASAILVVFFAVAKPFAAHPAAGGRGDRLRADDDADRRRPPGGAADRRAALARLAPAQARGAGGRRRLRRPDGRARAAAQPQPRRHRDRLRRRRPAQAGDADAGAEGAGLDQGDRQDPRRDRARRGRDRDPLGAGAAARPGRLRLPRARDPRPHPADRVRAAARRRPAQQTAARGAGRGRARPRPDRA